MLGDHIVFPFAQRTSVFNFWDPVSASPGHSSLVGTSVPRTIDDRSGATARKNDYRASLGRNLILSVLQVNSQTTRLGLQSFAEDVLTFYVVAQTSAPRVKELLRQVPFLVQVGGPATMQSRWPHSGCSATVLVPLPLVVAPCPGWFPQFRLVIRTAHLCIQDYRGFQPLYFDVF